MSARSLAVRGGSTAEPAAPAPAGRPAEVQFREALWHEYRFEAIKAGASADQAAQYASALSLETGLVAGGSELALVGRGWFYQSRPRVVRRTITSGLMAPTRSGRPKTAGRSPAATAAILLPPYRWWNAGE